MIALTLSRPPGASLADALVKLGRPGGPLDARDNLRAGLRELLDSGGLGSRNRDHPSCPAGAAFLVQFLANDLTSRAPALDLDAVYRGGPLQARQLYDPVDRGKLRVEAGGQFEDLPRAADQTAILGDPRNDENMILGGLHAAFLLAHNHTLDIMRARHGRSRGGEDVFLQAQRIVRWHYQWLIVHELLPMLVGESMVTSILSHGRRLFAPPRACLPPVFEAVVGALGMTMLRPSYRVNDSPFVALLSELRGGARAAHRFVDWQGFFDFGDRRPLRAKRIDTHLSTQTLEMHDAVEYLGLALPTGQAIARALRVPVLSEADLEKLGAYEHGLQRETPLFYYVLKEAEVMEDGLHLGPVGGRILAEVVLGLLQLDRDSYLMTRPDWRPTLPSRIGRSQFSMVDLLAFAGVDPASRAQ